MASFPVENPQNSAVICVSWVMLALLPVDGHDLGLATVNFPGAPSNVMDTEIDVAPPGADPSLS